MTGSVGGWVGLGVKGVVEEGEEDEDEGDEQREERDAASECPPEGDDETHHLRLGNTSCTCAHHREGATQSTHVAGRVGGSRVVEEGKPK